MLHELYTTAGEAVRDLPWQAYPRPQMRRASYLNLNGLWEFAVTQDGAPAEYTQTIRIPFCPESLLSGIGKHFPEGSGLYYRRTFTLAQDFCRGRVLLHIGAADQHLHCFVNGVLVGRHSGGYDAFSFDITSALCAGENTLVLRCFDDLDDTTMPYGKQTRKRGGMWYTPVSGIWQTVWLESVPETYIEHLRIDNRGYGVCIDIGKPLAGSVHVPALGTFPLCDGKVTIEPDDPHLWSPEDPYLYEFTIEAGEDRVESYFAIRALEIKHVNGYPRLCLNGKPYFFHGLLDQGYWSDGLFTPAEPACYADDILAMKRLGFNTLRKHIKVEPEEFYYQCDKLGMIVFQDMVNNGVYHYLRDTVLPTFSLRAQACIDDRRLHRGDITRERFLHHMASMVEQLRSHPCIVYWTIFNEGWGQFDSDRVYDALRALDDTRWIDSTSGWFRRSKTDVDSRHVYFRRVELRATGKKPLVLSEFGGYTCRIAEHIFNADKTYGYGAYETTEALAQAVTSLYMDQIVPCIHRGLCAAIYTQVSDVEDELNGLRTYDRKVDKLPAPTMMQVAQALKAAISEEKQVASFEKMG